MEHVGRGGQHKEARIEVVGRVLTDVLDLGIGGQEESREQGRFLSGDGDVRVGVSQLGAGLVEEGVQRPLQTGVAVEQQDAHVVGHLPDTQLGHEILLALAVGDDLLRRVNAVNQHDWCSHPCAGRPASPPRPGPSPAP